MTKDMRTVSLRLSSESCPWEWVTLKEWSRLLSFSYPKLSRAIQMSDSPPSNSTKLRLWMWWLTWPTFVLWISKAVALQPSSRFSKSMMPATRQMQTCRYHLAWKSRSQLWRTAKNTRLTRNWSNSRRLGKLITLKTRTRSSSVWIQCSVAKSR